MQQVLHIYICLVFLPFFSLDHLKPCQVAWGPSVDSHLWVIGSKSQRGWATQVRFVTKPLLNGLGCVRRVIVMLEGEQPSLRFWALWTRFSLRISLYLVAINFPSSLITSSVPAAGKHPQDMMLPPHDSPLGWYYAGDKLCLVSLRHE